MKSFSRFYTWDNIFEKYQTQISKCWLLLNIYPVPNAHDIIFT
jgi:hypothetical protein